MIKLLVKLSIFIAHLTTVVQSFTATSLDNPYRNVLILDHLNINHQKSRHDQLKAFYFDFLQCGIDVSGWRFYHHSVSCRMRTHVFVLP